MKKLPEGFDTGGRITYGVDTVHLRGGYGEMDWEEERLTRRHYQSATLISSRLADSKLHMPVIDIDIPVRLYPSSTEGHFHLYIDKQMTWRQYRRVLRALVRAGVVERGYYSASWHRRATHLRLPWIKKETD